MVGTIVVGARWFGVLNLFCWDKTSYNFVVDCYNCKGNLHCLFSVLFRGGGIVIM